VLGAVQDTTEGGSTVIVLGPLIEVTIIAIDIYKWVVIVWIILSWLIAFNVINTQNRFVYAVNHFLYRATEPVLRPIRRFIPVIGGLDISPVVLFLALFFVQRLLQNLYIQLISASY
jgi:YggT family protein